MLEAARSELTIRSSEKYAHYAQTAYPLHHLLGDANYVPYLSRCTVGSTQARV